MPDSPTAERRPYVALIVYEMGRVGGRGVYYREDFVLVWADDLDQARELADQHVRNEVYESEDGSYVRLYAVIDVNEVTEPLDSAPTTDLYSRHFASIDDYRSFEMFLGGKDPLA
ncbi:DUF4288 domain-containing protein [Nocardia cyriacigeorgica]|uniref:DUF4288 domain-containing protein n=1 Tax=Nocardia cyriacigeorgica TaxID=135487 RepID=UPI001893FDF4|nr:DUF4288 domain-containing protein [Nocardia cyriacigeorgica]MBF6082305.1 DUF4288 domain-containing protein [Nocardia cyriacigeorgica]MBF6426437.1 DUF4288 domain-containing protein [Nocardia cyriacigeorgica]BDU08933.1 hypothetical protein FMUBM48_51960 [Nocardia cyriacigeorgica]